MLLFLFVGDNLEQIETAYNNCPPGLESVIPMTCIEPEIRVAEEMMQASSAHENTASQPMKSLHIAHSDVRNSLFFGVGII